MLKKLLVFAITSGLAAKLYKTYVGKRGADTSTAAKGDPVPGKRAAKNPV